MPATPSTQEQRDYGCLQCEVFWHGGPVCWLCGSALFVVGAAALRLQTEAHR